MDAKIYILNPLTGDWRLSETIKDVSNEKYKDIEAYKEYNQGQVKVEYIDSMVAEDKMKG